MENLSREPMAEVLGAVRALRPTAKRLTSNQSAAEDLLQDTFERAFRCLDRYHRGTSAAAWMQTIMYRLAIDESRRARRDRRLRTEYERHRALLNAAATEEEPKKATPRPDNLVDVLVMAESLAEPCRSTFLLRTVEGLSYREISQRTGQPIGTVGRHLHQARQRLQEKARQRGVG